MSDCPYNEDYFVRGKASGLSLYENYRWMPDLTIPMVEAIIRHLGVQKDDTITDFGCARGFVVRAFRELGYKAYGVDASEWAIENCDELVRPYVSYGVRVPGRAGIPSVDWVIAKDVLEHIHPVGPTIDNLMAAARKGVFAVVPLSAKNGQPYVVPDYEKDVTHVQRLTLGAWHAMFIMPGWAATAAYRVLGVKDNYAQYERANGFITAKRYG